MSSVEKEEKRITRREFVKGAAVGAAAAVSAGVLAGCGAPTPEVVKETVEVPVEVEKVVKETVEVAVEKEVQASIAETVYEVYPPYGVPTIEVLQPVPRLDTLEGKTICGIGGAFHFEETWPVMAEVLAEKYPTAKLLGPEVIPNLFGVSGTPDPVEIAAELKKHNCDAVIAGNGC